MRRRPHIREAGTVIEFFEAYTADRQGERVVPGAFADTLKRWREGGSMIPVLADHELSWSIGFVVPPGGRRKAGKITELVKIDLAEVSVVPTPANRDARTLSIKAERPIQVRTFEC